MQRGRIGFVSSFLAIGFVSSIWVHDVGAQGIIFDRRPNQPIAGAYEIREVSVDGRIRDQVAEVQISQTFYNPSSVTIESEYLFPLPEEGAIQNFVLMVDGKEMPGRILPRDEARRIYEEIVRTKRDPALLEYMGRGLFKTSVFPIPAGAERKVTMRFTQLLKRERDLVEFSYPFSTQKFTAKPIQKLSVDLRIESKDPIKSVYSPSYDPRVERPGERDARVTLELRHVVPTSDFRLLYTLADGALGMSVLSYKPSGGEDGYFLLLASPRVRPPDQKPKPKTVVFVLDRSGSMAGKKIEQARNALGFVLSNLREDDTFNIVVYDDRVETFKPELQRYDSKTRAEAERFVSNIYAGGSTNISEALKTGLAMLPQDDRPKYLLFLTDGLPTAGETKELKIAEIAKESNKSHARIFSFGVGFDVNSRLLDRISGAHGGISEYVKPDDSIESKVAAFYSRITSPALTQISVNMNNTDLNRTYPRDLPDLFDGGQLVWVGRYKQSGATTVRVSGKVGGETVHHEFPAELARSGEGKSHEFVEKLWAIRRVGYIIDQIDLNGSNKELTDELVELSKKYGILTPYTAFLADERVQLHARMENGRRAGDNLTALKAAEGRSGFDQRGAKQAYNQAQNVAGDLSFRYAASAGADQGMAGMMGGPGGQGAMGGAVGGMMGRAPSSDLRRQLVGKSSAPLPAVGTTAGLGVAGPGQGQASVRQVGNKTFFRKDNRWVDSEVKPEDEAKARTVEQFSDEFFKLARSQSAEQNQYLSFDEAVTVNLGGQVYRVDPPKTR